MSRWFRFYDGALDDPKVQRLSPVLFKAWVNLLCLASRSGGKIPVEDVSFSLRIVPKAAAALMVELHQAGLIETHDGFYKPHNWDVRQFKSDVTDPTAAERMQRYRNKDRNAAVTVTPPRAETEQNTETEKKDSDAPSLRSGDARKRGSRLPPNFQLSEAEIEFAAKHGYAGDPLQAVFSDFCDYWHARAGPQGVKMDWPATWRRWIRTEAKRRQPQGKSNGTARDNSFKGALARLGQLADSYSSPGVSEGSEPPLRLLKNG